MTFAFGGRHSIQLSYGCWCWRLYIGLRAGVKRIRVGLTLFTMRSSRVAMNESLPIVEPRARAVIRGICRLFARNDIWALAEMPLRNGRRTDLMGVDAQGQIVIVEIKTARGDLLGDGKWPDYLDFCDRFYWGLPPELDRTVLERDAYRPDCCGIIVADGYDAEVVRPAPTRPLNAARRRVELERLARAALRRQVVAHDPECSLFGSG